MKNMKKSAMILFVLMILSKFLGVLRETVLAYFYPVGIYTDAYIQASSIPNVIFGIVAAGLVSTFIPVFSRAMDRGGEKEAKKFMDNTLTIVFFLTLILLIFGLLFTEPLVKLMSLGLKDEGLQIAIDFTRITLFTLLTNGVYSIFSGYHQYEGRFYVTPVTGFFLNIIVISSIVVSSMMSNPIILVYGVLLGSVIQLIFAYVIAKVKGGYKYRFSFDLKNQYLKPMLVMAGPIILGQSVNQINITIDKSIATMIGTGAATIINYATKISDAIFSLFVGSLTTVMYPTIIKQASRKEYDEMKGTIIEIMNLVSLIVIPATIGLIVLSKPVVQIYNINGKLSPETAQLIQYALIGATIGLFGMSIKDVLVRSFYSLNDSMTPVISSIVTVVLNVVLDLILGKYFGVTGLTMATSISVTVGMFMLYVSLTKKIGGLKTRKLVNTVLKITASSVVMGIVVFVVYKVLIATSIPGIITLGISAMIGVIIYVIGIYIFKIEEFMDILELLKVKIGRKKA